MPPPRLQSTDRNRRRRHVLAGEHRSLGQVDLGLSRQAPGDLVAEVAKVGGAGAEIVVARALVVGNLARQRLHPRADSIAARRDAVEGGGGQRLVLEHRHLELEDIGRVAAGFVGERADRRDRAGDGRLKVGALADRVARGAAGLARPVEKNQRSRGESGRCGPAEMLNRLRHPLPPRRNRPRPGRSARRRRHRRPRRPHGHGGGSPAAPWRPSP